MRAIIQRVTRASVSFDDKVQGEISKGLLVLLGIETEDNPEDLKWLSAKITNMRIFNDKEGLMNLSVKDTKGDLLIISQFTLLASTKKGNRPSFIRAARPEIAEPLYQHFIQQMENDLGKKVKTGKFGAMMQIFLINDGPVTIFIDTKNRE